MTDQEFRERVLTWIERADNWMERTEDWKGQTDNRLDNLEGRLGNLEGQMGNLQGQMGNLQEGIAWIRGKLEGKRESDTALWGKIAVLAALGSTIIALLAYFK